MKPLSEHFNQAENKLSRKADGKNNTDTLYPILQAIAIEGFQTWLEEERQDPYWRNCNNPQHVFTVLRKKLEEAKK
jgi:hypothetical protein